MSFFNPNSFDAHDERLYDVLPETIASETPEQFLVEDLPEPLIEDISIPPINSVVPTSPFQARLNDFTKRYANNNNNNLTPGEKENQEAATLREDLLKIDSLLKGLLNNPALNKASDQFTAKHIEAIKKYINGTIYYCNLLNNDLVKSKIPPYA